MDIKLIKPKKNKSDKYSMQLYNYMKRNYSAGCNVFYISTQDIYNKADNTFKTVDVPFNSASFCTHAIWIGNVSRTSYDKESFNGYIDWMYGNSLFSVLSTNRNMYEVFANPWNNKKTVIDITDWFWDEYIRIGKCVWDKEHNSWLAFDEDRFTTINKNSRKCNWCGKWQHRKIEKTVSISRKNVWELV